MKNFNINKNSTQSGRSMIEMLGVLAIVGVLSVGGIAGYSKAMEKFKINKTAEQISQVVTNIRTLYAQQTTYEGLNVANAIKMGVVPDSLATSNNWPYIKHSFNGEVEIDTLINGSKYFSVGYGGLPKEACIALATYDWGDKYSSGLISLSISGANGVSIYRNLDNDDQPLPKGCSARTDYDTFICTGQTMPVSSVAEVCNGCTPYCGMTWLYQ